jgi:tetratricopeptide (TPR) repeat protein
MRHLASLNIAADDVEHGVQWAERAVDETERAFGAEHALTALSRRILGWSLLSAGEEVHAERLFRENLTMHERKLGRHSIGVAEDLMGLSYALCDLGRADEAVPLARESYDLTTAFYGATHPSAIDAGLTLAQALRTRDRAAARALMVQLRERIEAARGVDNRRYIQVTHILGEYALAARRLEEARAYFEECTRLAQTVLGAEHVIAQDCRTLLRQVGGDPARVP